MHCRGRRQDRRAAGVLGGAVAGDGAFAVATLSPVRRRYVLAALVALVAAVLAGAGSFLLLRGSDDPETRAVRGSSPPRGMLLPEFELRDHEGVNLSSRDLRGKAVVVTFLESKCEDACPLIARDVSEGLDLLEADERRRVVALAVSTHPEDDTPANVRAFLEKHGVEGELRYLIGSERDLRPVWKKFQVVAAADTGDAEMHSAPVRIFTPEGKWVSTLHAGVDLTPENLAHDVRAALA